MCALRQHCDVTETMNYILTQCGTPGQKEIWELDKQMWTQKNLEWRQPWIGSIISCGLAEFSTSDGKRNFGADRLWRIVISESAHQIWKMRGERVIRNESTPYTQEVRNKWYKIMDDRLEIDCRTSGTTNLRYGRKGQKTRIVTNTWKGTLENEEDLRSNCQLARGKRGFSG